MKLDRKTVTMYKNRKELKDSPANLSKSEALSFVWELTKEVYSLSGKYDVESRLQRHVVSLIKKQR